MAMVYCRECGHKHSDRAKACPKCGYQKCYISKSIVIYLILCWFFGVFGAHRFYARKTGSAIAMLILTCTIYGLIITSIWALVDFIVGLCNIPHPENIFDNK